MVRMDTSCLELQLPGSTKPFVLLASGMLPERLTRRGRSTTLCTSSPKAKALARASDLALQACARAVLAFLVKMGRGKRCRSWFTADQIAELLPRSSHVSCYSVHHVRRALRQLAAAGLIRTVRIDPGECFPHKDKPDVDGGGLQTHRGGNVYEVNLEALLGRGPIWLPPPPEPPSIPDLDDDGAEDMRAPSFPGLAPSRVDAPMASQVVDQVEAEQHAATPQAGAPELAIEPAVEAPAALARGVIHDAGRVIIHAATSDPCSPSPKEKKIDPAPPKRDAPPAAPASDASETPSAPVVRMASWSAARADRAPSARAAPANVRDESERQGGREEQEKCQGRPASVAEARSLMLHLYPGAPWLAPPGPSSPVDGRPRRPRGG